MRVQADLDDLDDPVNQSDRTPLTGRISNQQAQTNTRQAGNAQGYLNSAIPGEDRRAPINTIDESVWETLKRDLLAVWEKMRQVLYPKYLFGGMMNQGGGMGAAERGEGDSYAGGAGALGHIRGIVGRVTDADTVLQGSMSEGLRDWDLWYGHSLDSDHQEDANLFHRGPLLFCLLLSFLLSVNAREDQRSLVFSGVFATIWIAEAVVTLQIKLLGGNMYVSNGVKIVILLTNAFQLLLPIYLHHRLHTLPTGHCFTSLSTSCSNDSANTCLCSTRSMVASSRGQHFRR